MSRIFRKLSYSVIALTFGAACINLLAQSSSAAPLSDPASQRINVPIISDAPGPASTVPPVYPEEAKARKLSGTVQLLALLNKSGSVRDLKVVKASNQVFVQAAEDAVYRWKYKPYLLNGKPTEVQVRILVNF